MNYELKHYDLSLVRFSATEDTNTPEIKILWVNEDKKDLFPLDLELTNDGLAKWLNHRTIPKNRAYVHNFLSKCGLNINRPMTIIKVSKGNSIICIYGKNLEFLSMKTYSIVITGQIVRLEFER